MHPAHRERHAGSGPWPTRTASLLARKKLCRSGLRMQSLPRRGRTVYGATALREADPLGERLRWWVVAAASGHGQIASRPSFRATTYAAYAALRTFCVRWGAEGPQNAGLPFAPFRTSNGPKLPAKGAKAALLRPYPC